MNRAYGISAVEPAASQPLPSGTSAVSLRHLSRGTLRYVSRDRTAEMPLKVRLLDGLERRRDFAGLIYSADKQASARRCRVTSGAVAASPSQKLKTSKGFDGDNHES
jgi:hypothetical protein